MSEMTRIPIIKLRNNLIVSLQGAISDRQVAQLKEDVTFEIQRTKSQGLVIDVSGVDIMDSYISRSIRDLGLVSRLMGVDTCIAGMDPMIAMTLVEMDLNLKGVQTELDLETALSYLRRRKRKKAAALARLHRR